MAGRCRSFGGLARSVFAIKPGILAGSGRGCGTVDNGEHRPSRRGNRRELVGACSQGCEYPSGRYASLKGSRVVMGFNRLRSLGIGNPFPFILFVSHLIIRPSDSPNQTSESKDNPCGPCVLGRHSIGSVKAPSDSRVQMRTIYLVGRIGMVGSFLIVAGVGTGLIIRLKTIGQRARALW